MASLLQRVANKLLPKGFKSRGGAKLESITIRGFGGGLNTVSDDINMDPANLVTQTNMHRTPSRGSEVRFGEEWLGDVKDVVAGNILDHWYYAAAIICVTDEGEIAAVDDDGVATAIWNSTIAAALPGAPTGWTPGIESCDFVPFKTKLVIHNGVDKPVEINSDLEVSYLDDEATGSNANTPIAKYGCTAGNYHVVAGFDDPDLATTVYIASQGTIGTFPGDPPPNDAISLDVGAYVPEGSGVIRGIAGFRQLLLVFFARQVLILRLGEYDADDNHTPVFEDVLPHFGLLGHRNIVEVDNDILFADTDGVNSAKRNLFSGLIDSQHQNDLIAPTWQGEWDGVSDSVQLFGTFAVHDRLGNRVLFFTPNGTVFVYTTNERLKYRAWSLYEYPVLFTSACVTALGRVILARGTKLFKLGNRVYGETFRRDLIGDRDDNWMNSTNYVNGDLIRDTLTEESYTCLVSHTSAATGSFEDFRDANPNHWELYEGEPIDFEMETPWFTGRDAMQVKQLRFAGVQSKGLAQFELKVYVDNLYRNSEGIIIYDPALTLEFVGNDIGGYGNEDQPFGGGRRSGDPRLFGYPVKFKSAKFRITGSATEALQVIGMNFLFSRGAYKR